MNYFTTCQNLEELKQQYRKLAMLHHPDLGGSLEAMKAINNEHDALFELLKRSHNASAEEHKQTTETAEEFRDIIDALINLVGLELELCGCWLWIGGDTRTHKDALKAAGCKWSSSKKLWYWHHIEEGHKWRKGNASMNSIRNKYGSETIRQGSNRINTAG